MDFTVIIPVLNQHGTTEQYIESWFTTAKGQVNIIFIDNGSKEPLAEQPFIKKWQRDYGSVIVVRNETNTGVYPTFQQGYELTNSDFIFYSHNDVEMKLYGWDDRLSNLLQELQAGSKVGVCGMFGAKGIGTPDIYKSPYHFTQLMRWDCITVESMHGAGGRLIHADYERVMVLDGFSLIVSREMINNVMRGKFDYESYPVHHMYDQDICVTSHYGGYSNYVLDIDCIHHGGQTSTREKWAEEMGSTDLNIHRKAHEVFYKKWYGKLPVGVK